MRQFKYSVYFEGGGEEVVTAGCSNDAVILACANRISKGFHIRGFGIVRYNDAGNKEASSPLDKRNTISVGWE